MTKRCEVVIVGSGFAGAILARILAKQGRHVVLLERGRHPRFAIGESSTPLAALSLVRLAARYGLPDLHAMAAWGRWMQAMPEVRRGRKRGFTFYHHDAGQPFWNDASKVSRLLVAASPGDRAADTHWLRADVDARLVELARAAGADYRESIEVTELEPRADGMVVRARGETGEFVLEAEFLVDATGPSGLVSRCLDVASAVDRMRTRSALLFSHLDNVPEFAVMARDRGIPMPDGPYADDWAAVHHCFEGGWMYQLRFDHGTVSAGFLLGPRLAAETGAATRPPADLWNHLGARYPSVGEQLASAVPRFPFRYQDRIQHRMARATGPRWVALPHTFAFVDPLFSTGIAWGLLGVERLASLFEAGIPAAADLDRYESLLDAEASQIDHLVSGACQALGRFRLFASHALLYFAAVSFAELSQRLVPRDDWAWSGFLGVMDPVVAPWFEESCRRIAAAGAETEVANHEAWVATTIAPRNVAGLADPARNNLYGVRLDILVERAALLGLDRERILAALPGLREG